MIPSREEWNRELENRYGKDIQNRFERAVVAVCGLGGLGSNIANILARAGVGKLILIDFDRVDISNLHRQQYKASQVGQYKTEALRENLMEIAPYLECEIHTQRIRQEDVADLLREADVVIEALDLAEEKSMLVNAVMEAFPEKDIVAASGMAGFGTANTIQTQQLMTQVYICGDGQSSSEKESLVASRVAVCAAHQAHMALRLLAGEKTC